MGRTTDAVIVAAGRGLRLGGAVPKQFRPLGGRTLVARALDAFLHHAAVRRVIVAIGAGDGDVFAEAVGHRATRVQLVTGGETRQASVRAALDALADDPPDRVLVHDAARPFLTPALIDRVIAALDTHEAVVPGIAVADTLKRTAGAVVSETVSRDHLHAVQTPQGFHYPALVAAHAAMTGMATDDGGVMEAAGYQVAMVTGERNNQKITTADDLAAAEAQVRAISVTGQGFDVHRLADGGPMVLGGIEIEIPLHLVGHSDADVALHALTDALLGAISDGDIGHHFPPSEAAWKGASSDRFLSFAADRVRDCGGEIAHLDLTLLCERPKVGPHRERMRRAIAAIADIPVDRVAVKGTTTEGLGFIGRGEGIAAQATATILRASFGVV